MAELPIELWHLIFDHLQLVDLSSCAQVSKAVYFLVKAYRIREIAFTGRVYEWFHYTTPTIDHKRRVDFTKTSILKWSSFNFDYLKRLKIGRCSPVSDLKQINRFVHLEELDIDLKRYKKKKNRTLSLGHLKVLYLFVPDDFSYVELDTPRLAKVCTFNLKKLEFLYPESVRCIHTFFHDGKLSMFRNLEYLTFTDSYNHLVYNSSYAPLTFDDFNVEALNKLKEIDFYYRSYSSYRFERNNMNVFLRMAAKLRERPDLKVFWQNMQMTDPNLLTEYELSNETVGSVVAFQLQHYEMLKEKDHISWLFDFNSLMIMLTRAGFSPRSEEFLSKFFASYSFRMIKVTHWVTEEKLLLELIARSPDLFFLEFWHSGLHQSFFDQMADTIRLNAIPLQQLLFKDILNKSRDLHFVSKLRHLELFETDQRLSIGLMAKLLGLPSLVEIKCSGRNKRIERLSRSRFLLNGKSILLRELLMSFPACI